MEKRSGGDMDKAANGVATPTKKTRTGTALRKWDVAVPKKEPAAETGHDAEEPKTLDVTLPVDALECPPCFAPFQVAVFQCKNGHAACRACCDRVQGTCPSCRAPIGAIRCRPLEIVIAAMLVPCGFTNAGCKEKVPYTGKRAHEAAYCHHPPCACPVPGCAYSGLLLHDHIRDAHRAGGAGAGAGAGAGGDDNDAVAAVSFVREATVTLHRSMLFRVLLHAPDARVFLLLNGGDVPSGRSLALLSVGPRPAANHALEYTMVVRAAAAAGDPGPGSLSLSASGPVPCTRRWAGPDHLAAEGFLYVPDAYWSSFGSVSVTVHVKKRVLAPAPVIDRP